MALPPSTVEEMAAVELAAAHNLNEELTVILSAVTTAIRKTELLHSARQLLFDIPAAAQRAAWHNARLLNHAQQNGARPSAATLERITES